MTTVGGDQRDRSSTAAVSFTQDSELIGQIDIQRYVNSLQSTAPAPSLAGPLGLALRSKPGPGKGIGARSFQYVVGAFAGWRRPTGRVPFTAVCRLAPFFIRCNNH